MSGFVFPLILVLVEDCIETAVLKTNNVLVQKQLSRVFLKNRCS